MTSTAPGLAGKASWIVRIADLLAAIIVAVTLVVCSMLSHPARAADAPSPDVPVIHAPAPAVQPRLHKSSPYHAVSVPNRARTYYLSIWGVDNLLARETASGSLIRFSYRVVDPARAKLLGDERATPYMYGERSHALLQVPVMEQVGPLRQSTPPKEGKEYWMVFSNKGNLVRSGDRVDVVIGAVRVDGLLVE